MSDDTINGTVKHWNAEKRFGFIAPDAGGDDVFFHASAVVDGTVPEKGDRAAFAMGLNKRTGRPLATSVTLEIS